MTMTQEAKTFARNAVTAVTLLAGGAAGIWGLGNAFRRDIGEGKVGLDLQPQGLVGKAHFEQVPVGSYWFGRLRYPNSSFQEVEPRQQKIGSATIELTPGTWDKIVTSGQKSVLLNILPVTGDLLREGVTRHLEVDINMRLTLPQTESEILAFYNKVGSFQVVEEVLDRAKTVLTSKEEKLDRRFFKPKLADVEAEIKKDLEEHFGISGIEIEIAKISKVTKSDEDRKGIREAKINMAAEVVFQVGSSRFALRK